MTRMALKHLNYDKSFRKIKRMRGVIPQVAEDGKESHTWENYFANRPKSADFIAADVVPVDAFGEHTDFRAFFEGFRLMEYERLNVETNLDEPGLNYRWMAEIVEIAGYRIKLKLLCTEPQSPVELWVNWGSMDLLPVGYTQKVEGARRYAFSPPIGSALRGKDRDLWEEKILSVILNQRSIPLNINDIRIKTLTNAKFKIGDRLEVLNTDNSLEVRPAIVKYICGRQMFLNLSMMDCRPNEKKDDQWRKGIYVNENSPLIFPVGWAVEAGYRIDANDCYIQHCQKIVDAKKNGLRIPYQVTDTRPSQFHSCADSFKPTGTWMVGDCVEVLDPLDSKFQSLRAAHVKKVLHDGYLVITFENAAHEFYPVHGTSTGLYKPGYAAKYGLLLEAPKPISGDKFDWNTHIDRRKKNRQSRLRIPDSGLFRSIPKNIDLFVPGAKLEAADQVETRIVCPATVREVRGRTVIVTFDGWSRDFDQFFDCESPQMMPVGWAEMNGYFMHAPCNPGSPGSSPNVHDVPAESPSRSTPRKRTYVDLPGSDCETLSQSTTPIKMAKEN